MNYVPQITPASPITISQSSTADAQRLAQDSVDPTVKNVLLNLYINRIISKNEQTGITTSVVIQNLQSGQTVLNHNTDTEQFAASVNKLPIARLVLADIAKGNLSPSTKLTWSSSDVRAGAGTFDQPGAPTTATVQDLLFDMLNPSGNTAVRVLVNQGLGGAPAVNTRMKQELKLQHTQLQPVTDTPNGFYLGNTTAAEALTNITALLSSQDSETAFVRQALATNIYTDYGVRSQLAGNSYITLANKVGILDDPSGNNRHDVGVIYNAKTGKSYAYAFLNTAPGTGNGTATSQAGVSLADMGRGVLRYVGDKPIKAEKPLLDKRPYTDLRIRF